jgi:hypothetical protein
MSERTASEKIVRMSVMKASEHGFKDGDHLVINGYEYSGDQVAAALRAAPKTSDVADAAKWRALRNCARITAMGSAGIVTQQPNNYAHLTLNFWTVHDTPGDPVTLAWFDEFVEIAQRAQAGPVLKASG